MLTFLKSDKATTTAPAQRPNHHPSRLTSVTDASTRFERRQPEPPQLAKKSQDQHSNGEPWREQIPLKPPIRYAEAQSPQLGPEHPPTSAEPLPQLVDVLSRPLSAETGLLRPLSQLVKLAPPTSGFPPLDAVTEQFHVSAPAILLQPLVALSG